MPFVSGTFSAHVADVRCLEFIHPSFPAPDNDSAAGLFLKRPRGCGFGETTIGVKSMTLRRRASPNQVCECWTKCRQTATNPAC